MKFEHILPKTRIVDRTQFLLKMAKNKRVLHLGCVDTGLLDEKLLEDNLLHTKLLRVSKETYGVDIDKKGFNKLKSLGVENLILGNVEHLDAIKELTYRQFDVIIASDVIEHLSNPGLFLESMHKVISKKTIVIITTPNSLCYKNFLFALLRREAIHPEHNYSFSPNSIRNFLTKKGYKVKEMFVSGGGACVRFKRGESLTKTFKRVILKAFDAVLRSIIKYICPFLWATTLIVAATKGESKDPI